MAVSEATSVLPATWPQVLEKVRRTLRKAEADARKREANPLFDADSTISKIEGLPAKLSGLQDLIEKREQSVIAAKRLAEEAGTFLSEAETALQAWLNAVRKQLTG
jgi:hypothetical protein